MLHVLMFNNEFPPLGGGTATVNEAILNELALNKDIHIDLITSSADEKIEKKFSDNISIYRLPIGIKDIHHATNKEIICYTWKALIKAYSLTRKKNYHICFAWCTVPAGFLALIFYHLKKIPYVVRISGPDLPGFEHRYSRIVRILLPLLKHIWKKACKVLVKCEYERETLSKYLPESSIQLIPNGVDINKFLKSKDDLVKSGSDTYKILSVGRLIQRKQHDILIRTAGLLKDKLPFHITIVGGGDEFESLQKLIQKLDVGDLVSLKGAMSRAEMPDIYRNSDLFIHLSENEGMSIAVLEACASGLPVLCTNTGGIEYLVNNENGAIINIASPEIVAEQIIHLLKEDQLSARGKISRKRASSFQWGKIAELYTSILTKSVSSSTSNF